jgi:hypothetical protein
MRCVRSIGLGLVVGAAVSAALFAISPTTVTSGVRGGGDVVLAELDGDPTCGATGWFRDADLVVDAATADVVVVPRSDRVDWQGWVVDAPGRYEGSVWLELPPPFGRVEIDSWQGTTATRSNAGTEEYALPKALPGGVRFTVAGEHTDEQGTCSGHVIVELEGGPLGSPITWGALGATALAGVGLVAALRPVFVRRPSSEV